MPPVIHVVEPWRPGAGKIWRSDQSHELLMNSTAGQSTNFLDATFGEELPIVFGPTLYEWCALARAELRDEPGSNDEDALEPRIVRTFREHPPRIADYDEAIRREIRTIGIDDYPSRALYGHYLEWCFCRAAASLPADVILRVHRERARDCVPRGDGSHELMLESGASLVADAVAFALGWLEGSDSEADAELRRRHDGAVWIRPRSPIDQPFREIPDSSRVIVRGFGMGFIDAMILLSVGRGGRFVPSDEPSEGRRLRYIPSGAEPLLYVGSRRGVPFRAKPRMADSAPEDEHRFLRRLSPAERPAYGWSLAADLLPLVRKDAIWAYYSTLAGARPEVFSAPAGELLAGIEAYSPDTGEFGVLLDRIVPNSRDRLDLRAIERPGRAFRDVEDYREWLRSHVAADIAEAELGPASALKAATRSIGSARKVMSGLVEFGGLIASDYLGAYPRFLSFGAMLSGGPPASRLCELVALMDAGIVRPVGPDMSVTAGSGVFEAHSPLVPGSRVVATALLDAWMHKPTVVGTTDRLLGNLIGRGLAVPHAVTTRSGEDDTERIAVPTGALDVDPLHSRLKDAGGTPHDSLFAIGIPTEGARIFTFVSPTPRTASDVLLETNRVSKRMLHTAQEISAVRRHAPGG